MSIIQNSFNLFIPIFIIAFGAILLTTTLKKYLPPSISWLSIFLMMTGSSLLILHLAPVQKTPHWYFFFSLIYLGVFFSFAQAVLYKFNQSFSFKLSFILVSIFIPILFYFAYLNSKLELTLLISFLFSACIVGLKFPKIFAVNSYSMIDKVIKIIFLSSGLIFIVPLIDQKIIFQTVHTDHDWFQIQLCFLFGLLIFSTLLIISNVKDILNIHQTELERMRRQERLQFSHDLHDILGSSLVRSIGVISQSKENFDNQQFLSILKLLRDDLREVIDSGSSVSGEVPKTPILWGAPVRHRFSQIFNELSIQSVWDFAEVWHSQPSALECLTLLRITEEALTNVIKHSYAKKVIVRLYFSNLKQIILEIEDDGIGFNVDEVNSANVNIGLRSMKIRLEKIHSVMDVQSKRGQTIIRVIQS